jgi:hypothetical protein
MKLVVALVDLKGGSRECLRERRSLGFRLDDECGASM